MRFDSPSKGLLQLGRPLALGLSVLLLAACGQDTASNSGQGAAMSDTIEGQVLYRERVALPPSAEVEVELQDISQPDAPASTLVTLTLPSSSGPPYPFSMSYNTADIEAGKRYAMRASIVAEGRTIFTSTDYIDPFAEQPLEIMVYQVPEAPEQAGAAQSPLDGSYWYLVSLAGQPAGKGEGGKALDLRFTAASAESEARVSGFSGCNRLSGGFNSEGGDEHSGSLSFIALASTMMACAEGSEIESSYLAMLGKVDSFRLHNGNLSLLSEGEELATLKSAE